MPLEAPMMTQVFGGILATCEYLVSEYDTESIVTVLLLKSRELLNHSLDV